MPKLLTLASHDQCVARIGGAPTVGGDLTWPVCRQCHGNMQFVAEIPLKAAGIAAFDQSEEILMLFECQNEPGICGEWDAASGANTALLTSNPASLLVPSTGEVSSPIQSLVKANDYPESLIPETASDNYWSALVEGNGTVLGKLGGHPVWIQFDETPMCPCGAVMTFFARLEEAGGDINFGGGSAFAFVCAACKAHARFLWQC